MAHFMTRVELHGVKHDSEVYEKLHGAMAQAGFSRTIQATDGKSYHLPPAQYCVTGDYKIEDVRTAALNAAATVWTSYAVVVTQGGSVWQGLAQVT